MNWNNKWEIYQKGRNVWQKYCIYDLCGWICLTDNAANILSRPLGKGIILVATGKCFELTWKRNGEVFQLHIQSMWPPSTFACNSIETLQVRQNRAGSPLGWRSSLTSDTHKLISWRTQTSELLNVTHKRANRLDPFTRFFGTAGGSKGCLLLSINDSWAFITGSMYSHLDSGLVLDFFSMFLGTGCCRYILILWNWWQKSRGHGMTLLT